MLAGLSLGDTGLLSIRDMSGKRVGQSFSTPRETAPARVS
jgi:hypothetical protein